MNIYFVVIREIQIFWRSLSEIMNACELFLLNFDFWARRLQLFNLLSSRNDG